MLFKLCRVWMSHGLDLEVISMTSAGALAHPIRELGVSVVELGMRPSRPTPWAFGKLIRRLSAAPPDILQTWMYHADLMGGLAGRLMGNRFPVFWNIRHSDLSPQLNKLSTRLVARACAALSSRWPARVICCSERAASYHCAFGYAEGEFQVIPNGFDLGRFVLDPGARPSVFTELGLSPGDRLLVHLARYHPMKGHALLLEALATLDAKVHVVFCGDGLTPENRELVAFMDHFGVRGRCHLWGRRRDTARILSAADCLVSPSIGEGFPNVIGEAMACGTPCVVTDVGDSAMIVGDLGWVVPSGDVSALAEGITQVLALSLEDRGRLARECRARIAESFDIKTIAGRYLKAYEDILSK